MADSPKPRLLVIDDQAQVRTMLVEYFREVEFEVAEAEDVPSALAKLPAGFDVAISDIRMPGMSGVDFLREARTHCPNLGVFLITGYPEIETVVDAKLYGAQAYVRKPVVLEDFEQRIREYLRTRHDANIAPAGAAARPAGGPA
jgi:DNA-binding NtrC family response regulator